MRAGIRSYVLPGVLASSCVSRRSFANALAAAAWPARTHRIGHVHRSHAKAFKHRFVTARYGSDEGCWEPKESFYTERSYPRCCWFLPALFPCFQAYSHQLIVHRAYGRTSCRRSPPSDGLFPTAQTKHAGNTHPTRHGPEHGSMRQVDLQAQAD